MRDDIEKVICERPRSGQDGGIAVRAHRRRLNRIDGETDVKFEPMGRKRAHGWYRTKEFADFLSPIKGLLAKNVGRPWDKLYSELRRVLPNDNTTQRHVYLHLNQYVERHPVFEDGRVFRPQGGGWGSKKLPELRTDDYYVSAHGLLLRYRSKPIKDSQKPRRVERCQLTSNGTGYVKFGHSWYYVRFKVFHLPTSVAEINARDVFGLVYWHQAQEAYGQKAHGSSNPIHGRVATWRSVMSKRDIKQYVLEP